MTGSYAAGGFCRRPLKGYRGPLLMHRGESGPRGSRGGFGEFGPGHGGFGPGFGFGGPRGFRHGGKARPDRD